MERKNLYKNTARFYDGGNNRVLSEDMKFYKELLKPGMRILDIGCGTGRVALELIKSNVFVFGIDNSESMLEIFREKIKNLIPEERNQLNFIQADMTNFNLSEKYDMILFPFRVFQALTTDIQREDCLRSVKLHCHENTHAVINMFDPDIKLLENFHKLNKKDYEYYDEELDATVIRNTVGLIHDKENNTIHSKYVYELIGKNEKKRIIEDFLELGYIIKDEADELFKKNGFEIEALYSWWDRSPYDSSRKRELIYVLKPERNNEI
jgi:ubiquinone/menaquinone biosynthesis C-methylase UbiE